MSDIRKLMVREIPHLRRYALSLTRRPDQADDLVQDTLERAIRKQGTWRDKGSIRSWLFSILYRQFLNNRNKAQNRYETATDPDDIQIRQESGQERRYELRTTLQAMDMLPDGQRAVVLLNALEGLSYDEIASVMDIPVGTVRSRLARGREALRVLTGDPAQTEIRRVK